jgi:hypothetical protein
MVTKQQDWWDKELAEIRETYGTYSPQETEFERCKTQKDLEHKEDLRLAKSMCDVRLKVLEDKHEKELNAEKEFGNKEHLQDENEKEQLRKEMQELKKQIEILKIDTGLLISREVKEVQK